MLSRKETFSTLQRIGWGMGLWVWEPWGHNRGWVHIECAQVKNIITVVTNYCVLYSYLYRIPSAEPTDKVVLMYHGLWGSSAVWVLGPPEQVSCIWFIKVYNQVHWSLFKSLGYILHEEGYDVWLGNMRGNRLVWYVINLLDQLWNCSS